MPCFVMWKKGLWLLVVNSECQNHGAILVGPFSKDSTLIPYECEFKSHCQCKNLNLAGNM